MPFLDDLAAALLETHGKDLRDVAVVLPHRLAGVHFREALARVNQGPLWSPKLYQVHGFLSAFSSTHALDELEALLLLYSTHRTLRGGQADDPASFLQWAPTVLRDMDEVDSHLVNTTDLYRDLTLMEELDAWSFRMDSGLSPGQQRLMKHWEHQGALHAAFRHEALARGQGTRGIIARQAAEHAGTLMTSAEWSTVWFAGLEAPFPAWRVVMETWLNAGRGRLLWDVDRYYLDDLDNEAGQWMRKAITRIGPGSRPPSERVSKRPPTVTVVAAPHAIGSIQYALGQMASAVEPERARTCLVLADRTLLMPLLEMWPEAAGEVNVTLSLPLRELPVYGLLRDLLHAINAHVPERGYPLRIVRSILSHPCWAGTPWVQAINERLRTHTHSWITPVDLFRNGDPGTIPTPVQLQAALADPGPDNDPAERSRALIAAALESTSHSFLREQFYHAAVAIAQASRGLSRQGGELDARTRANLLERVLQLVRIDLVGDPLGGTRIMGLEAAGTIDAERIIVLGANEGALPSTDPIQTFIPFPVRRAAGLPSNEDRDAREAYPFHRLLHQCDELILCHHPEAGKESEPSRYIHQLELEWLARTGCEPVRKAVAIPLPTRPASETFSIPRTSAVVDRYLERYAQGIGPTALGDQLYCPLDHYHEHVLGLRSTDPPGPGLEHHEMGTLVHAALEAIHRPHLGRPIVAAHLRDALRDLPDILHHAVGALARNPDPRSGRSMLQLAMAQHALVRHLNERIRLLEDGLNWRVLELEAPFNKELRIDSPMGTVSVRIKGRMDRVDEVNGVIQVIDLKTGAVEPKELAVEHPKSLLEARDPRKALQLLVYAWAYLSANPASHGVQAAIIPLRRSGEAQGIPLSIDGSNRVERTWSGDIEELIESIVCMGLDTKSPISHRLTAEHCTFCGT